MSSRWPSVWLIRNDFTFVALNLVAGDIIIRGGNDVFVHISAVERAGLLGLAEGQEVAFEIKSDRMRGKVSADNLSLA